MTRVQRAAGRLLCLALLFCLGAPAQALDPSELVVRCMTQAYRYGNYAAGERILGYLKSLIPADQQKSSAYGLVQALELLTKVAEGQYSAAFEVARSIPADAQPVLKYAANLALAVGGFRAGRPELTDKYLPAALAYATSDPALTSDRFGLLSIAFQRELEKNPNLSLETALKKHDEAFACLATYKPGSNDCSGRDIWEAAGIWFRWMSGADVSPALEEKLKQRFVSDGVLLSEFTDKAVKAVPPPGESPAFWFNPQYVLGEADFYLTQAERWLARGRLDKATSCIDHAERIFLKTYKAMSESLDGLNRQLLEIERKAARLPGQPPLDYSLLDGDLSAIKARIDILRARGLLAGPSPDARTVNDLLKNAATVQAAARRGQGFLGPNDVRFTQLEALTVLKPPGWEDQVTTLARQVVDECRQLGYRPGEITALTYMRDLDSLKEAVKLSEAFIQESQATGPAATELRKTYQRAYDRLAELQIEGGQVDAAAETLGRAQQLPAVAMSQNLPKVQALRGQQEALQSELTSRKALGQDTKVVEELIARTKAEFFTELLNIKKENPQYESMLAIRPVNFSKLQKQIPANTCVVQYFPASGCLYVFVATTNELKIHKVAVTGEKLTSLVNGYRQTLMKTRNDGPEASELYNLLIQPLEADIAPKEVLAFIPTSTLNYLPLQALKAPDGHYLIEKKQCVSIVKSSDLESLAAPPTAARGGVIALGNPDGSLPAAAQEAKAITALFPGSQAYLGKDATSEHLAAAGKAGYVHLATHGVLDAHDASSSYLLVAGDKRLKIPQIFELNLEGVRLVTLSACQTALGKDETGAGSELATLASAFSVAGTNSVVASLWSIADESTQDLMTAFYSGLKAGKPISQALQQAELKLLKDPRYKSPYFWAPFVLLGDWR